MRTKKFLTLLLIPALVMTSFAGCSKKKKGDNATPTNNPVTTDDSALENQAGFISLGGYYRNDTVSMNIYLSTDGWKINGIFSKSADTPHVFLIGDLTHTEGPELVYSTENDEITFTFAKDSMTVKVNKGTTYSDFSGTYKRLEEKTSEMESVPPMSGSTLELLSRAALTHYVTMSDGVDTATVTISEVPLDNASMVKFLVTYADLFLVNDADFYPEVSEKNLMATLTEEQIVSLLSTATDGAFSVDKLDVSGSDIVVKDNTYYIPCYGKYAGGIATRYTEADPAEIPAQLVLDAAVNKSDGANYYLDMTLSTVTQDGIVHLNSVSYKIRK